MSPSAEAFSRFKEPSDFDSDFGTATVPDVVHRFPPKHVDGVGDPAAHHRRSQHYADVGADSEPDYSTSRSRSHSRPRYASLARSRTTTGAATTATAPTTSSAAATKRSRKTSSSTARDLVRALLHERLSTDASAETEAQLAHAYDIIRTESRRAADAERAALETASRLKALSISRSQAQSSAARAQAELRAYKLQLENAQRQLEEANAIAAASDAERARAEQAALRLKRAVEKYRLSEEVRRAREEGLREGLQESYYGVPPPPPRTRARTSLRDRGPLFEDDDDVDFPHTPTSNVPLPVPPPASVPIMSRRVDPATATPALRRAQTPMSASATRVGDWRRSVQSPVPDVVRRSTTPGPTPPSLSRRAQTPMLPVRPPSAGVPILQRRAETPGPGPGTGYGAHPGSVQPFQPVYEDDFDPVHVPVPETRDMHPHINSVPPVPDHIIIRSPVAVRPNTPSQSQSQGQYQTPPAPVYPPARPPSSQASRHGVPRHARHYSLNGPNGSNGLIGDPARRASESASRIYEHYPTSSSSQSSTSEPPLVPVPESGRPPSRILRRRDDLPMQETIVPRPASGAGHHFSPPGAEFDSIPASAAELQRARHRQSAQPGQFPHPASASHGRRRSSLSSSSSSPSVQGRGVITPSSFARAQRLPHIPQHQRPQAGDRSFSAESNSSVPGITIEPPSRPESVDSVPPATPFIDQRQPNINGLPNHAHAHGHGHAPAPSPTGTGWGVGVPPPGVPGVPGVPQPHHQPVIPGPGHGPGAGAPRPAPRTGFMYGASAPGVPAAGTPGVPGGMGYAMSPPSPSMGPAPGQPMNFGPPGPGGGVIPPRPPSADYFTAEHHRPHTHTQRRTHGPGPGHGHGHRREPARFGDSVDSLPRGVPGRGGVDPNAFHDPDTEPSLSSSDTEVDAFRPPRSSGRRDGSRTPRATTPHPRSSAAAAAYGYDDRRASLARSATPGPPPPPKSPITGNGSGGGGGGFVPPRPPSSSGSTRAMEDLNFSSPYDLPQSSRIRGGSSSARSRKTSVGGGRPASRTAHGNTPFVRSSGLYDDE